MGMPAEADNVAQISDQSAASSRQGGDRNYSSHDALQPLLAALPIREHAVQKFIECSPMVGFGYVAKLVRDHVVDCVDWRFDEASISAAADLQETLSPNAA